MNTQELKTMIKGLPGLSRLAQLNRIRKRKNMVSTTINTYKNNYIQYSASLHDEDDEESLRRTIIIESHVIEKGLSHSDFRPGFGRAAVTNLQKCIKEYNLRGSKDTFATQNAINLLNLYHTMNSALGFDDSEYVDLALIKCADKRDLRPLHLITGKKNDSFDFQIFSHNRHSIRCYEEDGLPIDDDTLKKVVNIANCAPSACNRQATHVFAITDRSKFEEIERLQKGCKGFGKHASAFLFIVSDLSLYTVFEYKLPIFDAGIYTMNLLYALENCGLYSCVLNASFPGDDNKKIHDITNIPDSYEINGLIVIYKLPSGQEVLAAASPRRSIDDVLFIIK